MLQPIHSARRHARALLAALACGAIAACSGPNDILPPEQSAAVAASLQVSSRDPQPGVAEHPLPESVVVRVLDQQGRGLPNAIVHFAVTAGGGTITPAMGNTDAEGYVKAAWVLGSAGEQAATARVDALAPKQLHAYVVPVSAAAAPMLGLLESRIASAISNLTDALPLNPGIVSYMESRIALLKTPGLGGDIVQGRRYAEGVLTSRSGSTIPVTAVFPLEAMRAEAVQSIAFAASALPIVEDFLARPFPAQSVRIWHGFNIGNSGGGGTLNMEDRLTYETRTPPTRLPYDAIIVHELSHSYVGNESLTQFLELYGYNVLLTGSADVQAWVYTRGWVPGQDTNEGVHALLDVYRLIGPAAMATAYRAVLPLQPVYGQPLSEAVRQAFVDAAPAAAKAAVAAKVAKVQL